MRVTIAQMDIALGKKAKNIDRAVEIIEQSESDLILFPELFTTGFDFENLEELSENVPGDTTQVLSKVCGDSIIGGSIVEKEDNIHNTFFLLDKDGPIDRYRKIHLFKEEKNYFLPGREPKVIDTKFGKVGLTICYDLRFPELFRELAKFGAEIILVASEFPSPRENHWKILLQSRAIENQVFVIGVNRVGRDKKREYFGKSMVIDPWGEILIEGGYSEEILSSEVDFSLVSKIRNEFPVLGDSKIL